MKLRLNHIGLVVENISEFANILRSLGLSEMTPLEPDPIQKVSARFVTVGGNEHDVHLELLEPTDNSSPISNFLTKSGGGLHHLCFEVDNIDQMANKLTEKGFQIVCPSVECVGYDRSFKLGDKRPTKIAFFLLDNKILIELLQKGV